MSTTPKKSTVTTPDDPDPTPMNTSVDSAQVQGAVRNERKKMAANYSRTKTILASAESSDQNKKTILGG